MQTGVARTQSRRVLSHRYTVVLVCLLLLVAAIDTIPDPPIINPSGNQTDWISSYSNSAPFNCMVKGGMYFYFVPLFGEDDATWLDFVSQAPHPNRSLRLQLAADSSPPVPI